MRTPALIPDGHVTLIEAARRLRLTYQQAHNRALTGALPAMHVRDRWYVLERALKDSEEMTTSAMPSRPTHIHERVETTRRKKVR